MYTCFSTDKNLHLDISTHKYIASPQACACIGKSRADEQTKQTGKKKKMKIMYMQKRLWRKPWCTVKEIMEENRHTWKNVGSVGQKAAKQRNHLI